LGLELCPSGRSQNRSHPLPTLSPWIKTKTLKAGVLLKAPQ
jgi:hypothetical protein